MSDRNGDGCLSRSGRAAPGGDGTARRQPADRRTQISKNIKSYKYSKDFFSLINHVTSLRDHKNDKLDEFNLFLD